MKSEIRNRKKSERKMLSKDFVKEKSRDAAEIFLHSDIYVNSRNLMIYMPLGNETDTGDILKKALSDGKNIILPVTDIENNDIIPCYAGNETVFETGAFSISEPKTKTKADEDVIDTVIVPGIAFDKSGNRIGFGKGYYDRFLNKTKAVKIGFCFDFQLCDFFESEVHDIRMDYVITEKEMIKCK